LSRTPSARTIARLMAIDRDALTKAETVIVAAVEGGVPLLGRHLRHSSTHKGCKCEVRSETARNDLILAGPQFRNVRREMGADWLSVD
jgi:hypothetical protein